IILELEKQMRSLKIQATRARKYKEIKTELEKVDLFVLGRKLYTLKQTVDALLEERVSKQNERSELDAQYSKADAEVSGFDVLRIDQEKEIQSHDQQERDFPSHCEKLENQRMLMQEQIRHLSDSLQELITEVS